MVTDIGFEHLKAVEPPRAAPEDLHDVLAEVRLLLDDADRPVDLEGVRALVARLVPELRHRASALSLDSRM